MSGSSNFLVFDENALSMKSDADYSADGTRINGVSAGMASVELHNKLYRQVSVMVAALAQWMADQGQVVSDSDLAALTTVVANTIAKKSEFAAHLAEKATDEAIGHVKIGIGITVDAEGVISTPDNGRYQSESGFDGTETYNATVLDGSKSVSLTSINGTVTKTITPSDLKKWGNLKWTQNTPVNTNVVCDVLDALDNVLKAGVTSITDIPDIDITTHPSLKTRWTLTRNSVEDETPTVSDPSVTWEGADVKVQVASGTFSDTSTVISAGATYTKTIPLGFSATRGKLVIRAGTDRGAIIFFDTDINNTVGFSNLSNSGGPDIFNSYNGSSAVTSGLLSVNNAIRVKSVRIDGSDLVIVFESIYGDLDTLNAVFAKWEVEG